MKRRLIAGITLACAPFFSQAALDCKDSEYLVEAEFGVNPIVTDLPAALGLPGAASAELVSVQVAWLAARNRERDQETVKYDFETGLMGQVDLYDGSIGGNSVSGLRAAELGPGTDPERGQLNMNWCMPEVRDDGLIFALYSNNGELVGFQTGVFVVESDGKTTSVLNNAMTHQLGFEFATSGALEAREDIEAVTGVFPPQHLVEALFQRNAAAMLGDEVLNQALFHNASDGVVVGNIFIVTGKSASAYTPTSVDRVRQDGFNLLTGANQVRDLDNKLGQLSMEVGGILRPAFVIEGRADLVTNMPKCNLGSATVTADFERESILNGLIELLRDGEVVQTEINTGLEADVACDASYELRGRRSIRGQVVHEDSVVFPLADANPITVHIEVVDREVLRRATGYPGSNVVKTVWKVADLASLAGINRYNDCNGSPGGDVDTVAEIVANYETLTLQQQNEFSGNSAEKLLPYFNDSNSDGVPCDPGETDDQYVRRITLTVDS